MDERILHDTGVELVKTARAVINSYKKFSKLSVADEDLSVCGMEILNSLKYYPERNTVSELADSVDVSKGLVSREVETLRQKGYITTSNDENDRRILRISISDGADHVIKKQKQSLYFLMEQVMKDFNDDDFKKFRKMINAVSRNVLQVEFVPCDNKEADFDLDSFA